MKSESPVYTTKQGWKRRILKSCPNAIFYALTKTTVRAFKPELYSGPNGEGFLGEWTGTSGSINID